MLDSKIEKAIQAIANTALLALPNLKPSLGKKTEVVNSTGDTSLMVDLLFNDIFAHHLNREPWCAGVASEELEKPAFSNNGGEYLVVLDPLDGSSNLAINNSVGTIFGLFKCQNEVPSEQDFLQPAKDLVAAGYILYGTTTTVVVASEGKVIDFLTFEEIKCPEEGKTVAINSGNYPRWDQLTKNWFDTVVEYGKSSFRYSGCMVADFHRILIQGGMFAYPADRKNLSGKLRLLFECGPLAYIAHTAGGASTTGDAPTKSILNIKPSSLHQTTPVFLGSKQNIKDYFRG